MEITGLSSKNYTSAAAAVEEDEELEQQETEEAEEYSVATKAPEMDKAQFSSSDYDDETTVEEKAKNYIQNILFTNQLTEDSAAELQNYLNTFDVAQFIKSYGPFSSAAEISAAMYAVTAGMIKYQDEE